MLIAVVKRIAVGCSIATGIVAPPALATAQMAGHATSEADSVARVRGAVRAQAIALVTRMDPGPSARTYVEGYLAQPIIMGHGSALGGHVAAVLTLDFEGLTLERGQLGTGAYGEGYVDRRHPHTYLHEAVAVFGGAFRGIGVSLAGGKGFVPFGTDDPMMRPFAAYPVNHHLAQILERYIAIVAVRRGPVSLEGGLFNGDEPVSPGAPPDADRFGDSWAARGTYAVRRDLEAEASYASVKSPELPTGGLDQKKWSVGARVERSQGLLRGALVEWALTDEMNGDVRTNRFTSFLAEGSAAVRGASLSARFENTTRPEEERLADPFRYALSPTDLSIIGITRWRIGTVALSTPLPVHRADVAPFVEVAYARPTQEIVPSAFEPDEFYGATSLWTLTFGVRLGVGRMVHRMGRYGAGMPNVSAAAGDQHVH